MSHPLFLIRHYYDSVDAGKYGDIARAAQNQWTERAKDFNDVGRFAAICVERIGALCGSKARILDKVNLYKELIATGVGLDAGAISDEDAVMILAGWAGEMRKRFT